MNIKELMITKDCSIMEALKKLNDTGNRILLVVENETLIGVMNDGDLRRWILKNGDLNLPVSEAMNPKPVFLYESDTIHAIEVMKDKFIEAIPIVGQNMKVKDIIFWNEKVQNKFNFYESLDVPVVIMAGGEGTRLYPYTKVLPKPLIPVGNTTIIERILSSFQDYGCKDFYLTVNYKKNLIKSYFSDITTEYNLHYVEEDTYLGTGGSLYLLKDELKSTFIVSNCDILINANYSSIIKEHLAKKNSITMVTAMKNYQIPYGIIKSDNDGTIINLEEKPEYHFQVNTGFYVLEPDVLQYIPPNTFFHMTDLINICISKNERVGFYPIAENSWMDMGEMDKLTNMMNIFNEM